MSSKRSDRGDGHRSSTKTAKSSSGIIGKSQELAGDLSGVFSQRAVQKDLGKFYYVFKGLIGKNSSGGVASLVTNPTAVMELFMAGKKLYETVEEARRKPAKNSRQESDYDYSDDDPQYRSSSKHRSRRNSGDSKHDRKSRGHSGETQRDHSRDDRSSRSAVIVDPPSHKKSQGSKTRDRYSSDSDIGEVYIVPKRSGR